MNSRKTFVILSVLFICISNAFSQNSEHEKPWVAVHDFSVSPELQKQGINGWDIAGKIENELVQTGQFRIVIRAKINKVLREKNLSSSSNLDPSKFGKLVGADYIVTGHINKSGNELILVGKLVDVSKDTGEVEKSFDVSATAKDTSTLITKLPWLFEKLAHKLSITPGELLDSGIELMNKGKYAEASEVFMEVKILTPVKQIRKLIQNSKITPANSDILKYLNTPGELLDFGIIELKLNNKAKALAAFKKFETLTPYKKMTHIFEIGKMQKEAENLANAQKNSFRNTIIQAEYFIENAKALSGNKIDQKAKQKLCDKVLTSLKNLLLNANIKLTNSDRVKIKQLTSQIKNIRPALVPARELATIAVLPFTFIKPQRISFGSTTIPSQTLMKEFSNQLLDYLVSSNKFSVMDRDNLRKVLDEYQITESEWAKPGQEQKIGQLLIADYLVIGHIDRLSFMVKPIYIQLTGKRSNNISATLKVQFRVVKIKTGKVVFSKQIIEKLTNRDVQREIPLNERKDWTLYDYKDLLFNRAAIKAGNDVLAGIFPVKISSVSNNSVTINRGEGSGISVGQQYSVFNLGNNIIDPDTGRVLGETETEVATIEITRVNSSFSNAKIVNKTGQINNGSICRKIASNKFEESEPDYPKL